MKIKMTRNRSVAEYIKKNRVIRQDMITAGCQVIERENKKATMRQIINGMEFNDAWENSRKSWKNSCGPTINY